VAFALLTSVVLIAYLAARAGWDRLPVRLPIAHAPLLLVLVVLQLAIVVLGVLVSPQGFSHDAGAWIGLVEALLGAVAILGPVVQSTQRR
jgi:predicted ferric reductase